MEIWNSFFQLLIAYLMVNRVKSIDDEPVQLLSTEQFLLGEGVGTIFLNNLNIAEEKLFAQNIFIPPGSHASRMSDYKKPSKKVIEISRNNLKFVETLRFLKANFGLKDDHLEQIFTLNENISNITSCLSPKICPKSDKYRTLDGSCNSNIDTLQNLGRAVSGFRRLLRPEYKDGIYSPRSDATDGSPLPIPRSVSVGVFLADDKPLQEITNMMMQYGQFLIHDMAFTTQFTFANGTGIQCCASDNFPLDPNILNSLPHCLPILIQPGDYFLSTPVVRCMNFVRSNIGPNRISCSLPVLSYAEQINQNTHWLDASTVYGSNVATMNSLRSSLNSGLLRVSKDKFGRELLPITAGCKSGACFFAGDQRLTEHPQLTVMHTLWMREHNRIARFLKNLNPTWSQETVFQESRRIVIAEMQHITYNEFLPALIGKTAMTKYGLTPLSGGSTFTGYSTKDLISGPITNEFATAAFRSGHSLVQGLVQIFDENDTMSTYLMRDFFNNPEDPVNQAVIVKDKAFFDSVIRGLVKELSQTIDTNVADDIWLLLFQNPKNTGQPFDAFDLVALNTQRGRDHGLPSYNSYRKFCGLPALTDPITSLPTDVDSSTNTSIPRFFQRDVASLSNIYHSVDDIDLYIGGLAEISTLGDGIVGPTMTCLIAENFHKLKFADRYFYESKANPYPFTTAQLAEIKKASMARILCDDSDGTVTKLQPKTFFAANGLTNPMVSCTNVNKIPKVNLNQWKLSIG